jgi:phage terminase large subunit-like protein
MLVEVTPARGLAELADTIRVKHVSGGISTITLKAYSQGRERFQGSTIDFLSLDEEPPLDVFLEALTRTNTTQGPTILTFTPVKGLSNVVKRYLMEKAPDRHITTMTLSDALHYDDAQREQIVASYPEHERDARTKGIPAMGSGRVFPIDEETLLVEPFECPKHWLRWGGLDFGWTHYAAFCELWWDRDFDVIYLARTVRMREKTPLQHVQTIREWNLTWAWPHDGRNQTLAGAGVPLMSQYRDAGLEMMPKHATFENARRQMEGYPWAQRCLA